MSEDISEENTPGILRESRGGSTGIFRSNISREKHKGEI